MQGPIAQAVALTIYGNAVLGTNFNPADFYPSNSTFRFCESVTFSDRSNKESNSAPIPYAADPAAWFASLRNEGVSALRLVHGSSNKRNVLERILVAFGGGGGKWSIEAIRGDRSSFWKGTWLVGDRDRKDRRKWRVDYCRIATDESRAGSSPSDLEDLKSELGLSLRKIADFARAQKLDGFATAFESALSRLASPQPYDGLFHSDIAPPGFLPLAANQLLAAAQDAWVFGGMGSWNDVEVGGLAKIRADSVSHELFQLLNQSIVAAANSRMGSAAPV